jgi:hypothetical protein
MRLFVLVALLAAFGLVVAGTLDPPGPPAPTMVTLQQIYDKIGLQAVNVRKTGQTGCWDGSGNLIVCSETGQDGEFQKGTSVSPRFTDNGNGTVKDNLSGLIWLKNANCFGLVTWTTGLADANVLASGSCGLTDGSATGAWRLPNVEELQSLINWGKVSPALPTGHPFTGVVNDNYWSSTTNMNASPQIYAWGVSIDVGPVISGNKTGNFLYVWPVRGGQ